jgi:hypothetical protein
MMNKTRSLARSGAIGCPCCRCRIPNRTTRTRERALWKREVTNL